MKATFALNPKEIRELWNGHRHGERSNLNRVSSSVDLWGATITLTHTPTGIEVKGEIPMGHYSNKQIKAAEASVRAQLVSQLTDAVARHLRISGR